MKQLFAFVLLMLAAACGRSTAPAVAKGDTELYSYVPPDTTWAVGVRLKHLRTSPLYTELRDRLPKEALPYEKEASEIVVASDGKQALVLARGKFDKARLMAQAPKGSVEFLRDDLLVAAEPALIGTTKKRTGWPLTARIPAEADLWLVTNGRLPEGLTMPERSNLQNLARAVEDLRLGVVDIDVSDFVQTAAEFEFASPNASQQVETLLRGVIGLARLQASSAKDDYLRALDSIEVRRTETRLDVAAGFAGDLARSLMKQLPR